MLLKNYTRLPLVPIFALLLFAFWQPAQCSDDTSTIHAPDELQEVRKMVKDLKADESLPSISVGVAQEGDVIWQESFGKADREKRRDANPHTMYSTASISKPFTAAGIMLLAERGEIELDDAANNYLHTAKLHSPFYDADKVTIRMLLNHTAGLPLHYQFFYEDESYERPAMQESIGKYGLVVYEPGEHYQYANFGYGVLDEIIANVSGISYTDFMNRELFTPLGLYQTNVGIGSRQEELHAIRYSPNQKPIPYYDFDHRGASAVYSSVHDLLRFGKYFTGSLEDEPDNFLSEDTRSEMKKPHENDYALGWIYRSHENGLSEVLHTGSMGGVSTILTMIPETNTVITVLTNTRNPAPSEIAREAVYRLHPDRADDQGSSSTREEEESIPEHLTDSWKGTIITYADTLDIELTFRQTEDEEIHVQIDDQPKTLLNNPHYQDGRLSGQFQGSVETEDAERRPYILQLDGVVKEESIRGALTAISLPDDRLGNALSSYVEFYPK